MDQIVQWAILGAALLVGVYGVMLTVRAKPSEGKRKLAQGFFVWPNGMSAVFLAVGILGILIAVAGRIGSVGGVIVGLVLGWLLAFVIFFASRLAGIKLAADGGGADQAVAGYSLLSASGLISSSGGLLGVGIAFLAARSGLAGSASPVEVFLALGLGCWVMTAFWSLPSALYRSLLSQDPDTEPGDLAALCARFRSVPGEMAFLAAAALIGAVSIAGYRFPADDVAGHLYPLGAFGSVLLLGALVSPVLRPAPAGKSRILSPWIGIVVFLIGGGLAAYFLASSYLGDMAAFYCFGVGLLTAMLLMLTARYRPPFTPVGSPFGLEIAVAEVLMVLAAAVLAFRWMAGYGVALCATGLFSSFAILFSIGALWAAPRAGEDSETDLSFMAHAASRFAEIVMAGGAFLIAVVLVRLFTERAELGREGIDITEPYPLIGMVIGASFPIALRALSQSGRLDVRAASFERSVLVKLGRWAGLRTLVVLLATVITPLLVAFFWRMHAAGAFLVGIAAAELFLMLTLWLGEVRNTADEPTRLTTRSAHVLAIGSGLITVLLVPPLIAWTSEITRAVKIQSLAVLFVVAFVWVFVVVWRRLRAAQA